MTMKISQITVGNQTYPINLPLEATPSITSLTISGDLTVSDTSDLNIVNCASLNCSAGTGTFSHVGSKTLTVTGTSDLNTVNCTGITCSAGTGTFNHVSSKTLGADSATLREDLTTAYLSIRSDSLTGVGIDCSDASIICPTLKASSSAGNLTVPTTSGTLALTSDLPHKTTLTLSGTTVSHSNILKVVVSYLESSTASWGKFSPVTSFTNTYSKQLNHKLFKCILSSLYSQSGDDQIKGLMHASGLIYFSELPVGEGADVLFLGWGRLISYITLSAVELQNPTITLTEI